MMTISGCRAALLAASIGALAAIQGSGEAQMAQGQSSARQPVRGYIGITTQAVEAEGTGPQGSSQGELVIRVVPGMPADRAGLRPGDVALAVNGSKIGQGQSLAYLVSRNAPGSRIAVDIVREGQPLRLFAEVGAPPSHQHSAGTSESPAPRPGASAMPAATSSAFIPSRPSRLPAVAELDPKLRKWGGLGRLVGQDFIMDGQKVVVYLIDDKSWAWRRADQNHPSYVIRYKGPGRGVGLKGRYGGGLDRGNKAKVSWTDSSWRTFASEYWTTDEDDEIELFTISPEGHLFRKVESPDDPERHLGIHAYWALAGAPGWQQHAAAQAQARRSRNELWAEQDVIDEERSTRQRAAIDAATQVLQQQVMQSWSNVARMAVGGAPGGAGSAATIGNTSDAGRGTAAFSTWKPEPALICVGHENRNFNGQWTSTLHNRCGRAVNAYYCHGVGCRPGQRNPGSTTRGVMHLNAGQKGDRPGQREPVYAVLACPDTGGTLNPRTRQCVDPATLSDADLN